MTDEGDSGAAKTSQNSQKTEKNSSDLTRFYALYIFCPKRSLSTSSAGEESDACITSGDGDLSLTVAATNLAAPAETDLRKSLSQRLSKLPNSSSEGNFLSVGLSGSDESSSSAVCYYCVLNGGAIDLDQEETSHPKRQYVVCFISFLDSSLDLFRPELDTYTAGIVKLLDAEPKAFPKVSPDSTASDFSSDSKQLSQVDGAVKEYLEGWYEVVLEYLARCVARLGNNIHYLIYASLLDAQLTLKGFTSQEEADIQKFIRCCSLSNLVQQMQTDETGSKNESNLLLSMESSMCAIGPVRATLCCEENCITFHAEDFSSTCQFCKMATEHLLSDQKSVAKIKETLESVKLAFIHNLNKLKRFLKQAETDHYALFRSLMYLKKSGAGDLLLRYVHLDANPETLQVLSVLQDFIKSKGQALV